MDDIIESLFCEVNVVSTHTIARAFDISEADARLWAEDLGVTKIGASYCWARPDAEALAEGIEEAEAEEAEAAEEEEDEEEAEEEDDEDE